MPAVLLLHVAVAALRYTASSGDTSQCDWSQGGGGMGRQASQYGAAGARIEGTFGLKAGQELKRAGRRTPGALRVILNGLPPALKRDVVEALRWVRANAASRFGSRPLVAYVARHIMERQTPKEML